VIDALLEHHEQLPEEVRAEVPPSPIGMLVPEANDSWRDHHPRTASNMHRCASPSVGSRLRGEDTELQDDVRQPPLAEARAMAGGGGSMSIEPQSSVVFALVWSAFFAFASTLAASPMITRRYRSRVKASMDEAARQVGEELEEPPIGPPGPPPPVLSGRRAILARDERVDDLVSLARRKITSIAAAYAVAGGIHALLTTVFAAGAYDHWSSPVPQTMFLGFLLPIVATVALVVTARPAAVFAWLCLGSAGLTLFTAGTLGVAAAELLLLMAVLHLTVPGALFLLFNLRHWRAVAPLVILASAGGGLGWAIGLRLAVMLQVGRWPLRLAGLVVGVAITLPVLRFVGARYHAKAVSDQQVLVETWWAIYSIFQTALIVSASDRWFMAASFVAFPMFVITSRLLLRFGAERMQPARPPALLLLRVFSQGSRAEALLDRTCLDWRCLGPVRLIAGPDLADRTLDPDELYAFLRGHLSREFVKDERDLDLRVASLDGRPDPDGRYRISEFFCHRDTWKPALDRLVERSDAILMDLRGFTAHRRGCRYELARLGEYAGLKPVVLLVDRNTDCELADRHLRAAGRAVRHGVFFLDASQGEARTVRAAIRLLLGERPAA